MALRAGYKGIKKYVADMLNKMNPGDTFATDAEIAAAVDGVTDLIEDTVGWLGGNLFSTANITEGSYLRANGEYNETSNWNVSDYLDIKNAKLIYVENYAPALADNPSICWYDSSKNYIGGQKYGNATTVKVTLPDTAKYIRVSVNNSSLNNIKVFCPTVETQLDNKADISALGTQEGATASKLYHPGEYFYKDEKFCTVIGTADVASGSTWTLNTNYVEGTVANLMLGNRTLGGSVDLNNITINGIYGFGSTPVNAPNVSNLIHGMLIVCRSYQDTIITQTIIQITNGMFVRRLTNGVWSDWTQFVDLT